MIFQRDQQDLFLSKQGSACQRDENITYSAERCLAIKKQATFIARFKPN